jgi:hypothetical protein
MKNNTENEIQIFINKKEMPYSHQNMLRAINTFLPYLTNDDLNQLREHIYTLVKVRGYKEDASKLEVEKHSWPYPDTKITAHDPPVIEEHEQTWGDEYENPS